MHLVQKQIDFCSIISNNCLMIVRVIDVADYILEKNGVMSAEKSSGRLNRWRSRKSYHFKCVNVRVLQQSIKMAKNKSQPKMAQAPSSAREARAYYQPHSSDWHEQSIYTL